eukprot:TRINITY_DN81702_c0_g1_i1.p2 TRINITY_DN81702_c0_g1~~TRINITY_DN81702_c0_g1_i1.p2  ORF type:complete len:283 (+),score=94.94 TRINITY_DN81702_c0_g1_i1:76-924(+)
MMARRAMMLAALLASATATTVKRSGDSQVSLRATKGQAESFVRALKFKQTLRVCNAYPDSPGMDVYVGKDKLSSKSLSYKECDDFVATLKEGDVLDFKVHGDVAGTFTVSSVPDSDAVMLMVISRHDTFSTSVAFESHVFASTKIAQAAVIDTYKGKKEHELRISHTTVSKDKDGKKKKVSSKEEMLRFNNLVALNQGAYELKLYNTADDKVVSKAPLVTLDGECYAVLRVGVEAEESSPSPAELVVYPKSDPQALESAAAFFGAMPALVATFAACFHLLLA